MSDLFKFTKKAFTVGVVMTTILWSVGVAALVPSVANAAACPTLAAGDLIKVSGKPAIYALDGSLKYRYFPDGDVFKSWNADESYGKYYTSVSQACFDSLSQPATAPFHVGYRPGSHVVKYLSSDTLYVVEPNNTLAPISESAAKSLYGSSFKSKTIGLSEWPYFTKLTTTITEAKAHPGMLVKNGGKTYYVNADSKLQEVSEAGMTANKFKAAFVHTVADSVVAGLVAGDKVDAQVAGLVDKLQGTGGAVVTTTGGTLTVSLAADTPAAGYVAKGAYNAEFTKLTVKNTSSASVRVDKVVVKRDGLGVDADITAIRLYDGSKQLGSDQAVNTNTHLATFNNINWDIAAGETKTLTVKADTYSSASGTNDYLAVTVMELEGAGTLSVSLPIAGNAMQYHAVSVAVVDVDALSTPGATTLISGATAQQVACFNIDTNANEGVYLKSMSFTNNGTISNDEVSNFVVKQGATELGKNASTFGSGGKVTVDMTTPYFIDKSKSKDVCVEVDIKGGLTVSKSLILQIAESKDVVVSGDSSKAQVVVTKDNATTFTAQSSQTMTIGQGTLTVARNTATLPVSTSLIDGVAHNKLATYKFSAGSTEGAKVTRLRLTVSGVDGTDLSNFELYKYDDTTGKETQVGSSQSISGSYVTFEDTSDGLFDVVASKNVVIHVYADVNSAAAWTANSAGVYIGSTNDNLTVKAKGSKSGDFIPAASVTLSSVGSTASDNVLFSNSNNGALVISLANDSPGATSVAKGASNVDFAHYKLYATGEDVSVTQLVVRAYNTSGTGSTASTTNEFTNVKLYDITTPATPVQLGSTVVAPSTGVSTFSFTLNVPKDGYKILKVVADVPTNSAGAGYLHFNVPGAGTVEDDISSTGAKSGVDLTETGSAAGNLMTIATPTVTVSWASGSTNNLVANAADQTLGTLQLTAGQYEDVKITTIKVSADDATPVAADSAASTNFNNVRLVGIDGTQYGTTLSLTDGGGSAVDYVQFEGINNLTITKGTTKVIYVKANVAGTSGTWYVGTAATSDVAGTGVTSGNSATASGTGTGRANAIQSTALLTFALDASNPTTKLLATGTNGSSAEETFMVLSADAQYEDVDITKLVLNIVSDSSSDLVHQAFNDDGIKLYHKVGSGSEVLVGSATAVSSTVSGLGAYYTATFNMAQGDLRVGKTTDDVLIVKGLLKGTENGLTSATSPLFRLGNGTAADDSLFVEARGVSSQTALDDAQFNSTSAINLSSNQMVAYKAYPTFTYVNPGSTLSNGAENDIFSFKVRANGGTVALKQLKFGLLVTDNVGTANNSYDLESFKFYRGTTDLTATVAILDMNGDSLEGSVASPTIFPSGTTKYFYVVWPTTSEEALAAGAENTYTIKATLTGFTTPADDDNIKVRLENPDSSTEIAQSAATYYLSPWDAGSHTELLALDDSTLDTSMASTSTASLIWSDKSAATHSAATGTYNGGAASSSGDWYNGYYVLDTPTSWATLVN